MLVICYRWNIEEKTRRLLIVLSPVHNLMKMFLDTCQDNCIRDIILSSWIQDFRFLIIISMLKNDSSISPHKIIYASCNSSSKNSLSQFIIKADNEFAFVRFPSRIALHLFFSLGWKFVAERRNCFLRLLSFSD